MKIRRIAGLFTLGLFSIGFFTMALITLLPSVASKPNRLGYYSICSFSPISTFMLLIFSALFLLVGYKLFYRIRSPEEVKKEITIASVN